MIKQYEVVGRSKPTDKLPKPDVYSLRVFAQNPVQAKCLFWKHFGFLTKSKASKAELLSCKVVKEKDTDKISVYQFVIKYRSRTDWHNMVKEVRSLSMVEAARKLYVDMAGHHRTFASAMSVIMCQKIKDKDAIRPYILQYNDPDVKFKSPFKVMRPMKRHRSKYIYG